MSEEDKRREQEERIRREQEERFRRLEEEKRRIELNEQLKKGIGSDERPRR